MGSAKESINISLSEPLKRFVDSQVADGRYAGPGDYVRDLIRADERRKAEAVLEAKLLEGLGGPESLVTADDWQQIRGEALARVKSRQTAR
jgi:antitoxin ParD1/3/4